MTTQADKAFRRLLLCGTLSASLLFACGCDRAWQAYEQIELGKPLPQDNLLAREGCTDGSTSTWRERAVVNLPAIIAGLQVGAIKDEAGRIIAKSYSATGMAHWGVCQTVATRWVMEVEVPEFALQDAPKGWEPPEPDLDEHWRVSKWLKPLAAEFSDGEHRWGIMGSGGRKTAGKGEREHVVAYPIVKKRIKPHVLRKLESDAASVPVNLGKDLDFSGLAHAADLARSGYRARIFPAEGSDFLFLEVTVTTPHEPVSNVLEYLMFVQDAGDVGGYPDVGEAGGLNQFTTGIFFSLVMWSYGKTPLIEDLAQTGIFAGVTRDGYDRTYRNAFGGTCRIQNLGGRRIRIESKYFDIFDPLMLLAILKFAMVEGTGVSPETVVIEGTAEQSE